MDTNTSTSARALGRAAPTRLTETGSESETSLCKVALPDSKDLDSVSTDPTSADARKPWRNLQARFQLAKFGASLIDGDDGRPSLVVSRWALCKSFNYPAEAEAWLKRVRGNHA